MEPVREGPEDVQPMNRPDEASSQVQPPVQPIQYQPPAFNPIGQYPQLQQYNAQGSPIVQPAFQGAYIVNSPVTIWTRTAQSTTCPYCQQLVTTTLTYNHCGSSLPWVACLGLFCSGFGLCCWVPFLCESCKDVTHVCPMCRRQLGRKGML